MMRARGSPTVCPNETRYVRPANFTTTFSTKDTGSRYEVFRRGVGCASCGRVSSGEASRDRGTQCSRDRHRSNCGTPTARNGWESARLCAQIKIGAEMWRHTPFKCRVYLQGTQAFAFAKTLRNCACNFTKASEHLQRV